MQEREHQKSRKKHGDNVKYGEKLINNRRMKKGSAEAEPFYFS